VAATLLVGKPYIDSNTSSIAITFPQAYLRAIPQVLLPSCGFFSRLYRIAFISSHLLLTLFPDWLCTGCRPLDYACFNVPIFV